MMKVGTYLIKRLKELGIKHVFGVPGDFNMDILDYVEDEEGIEWIGGCNELNSGYAADGYARINKISALITTFGVGELSAINAIAGSFSEIVPVVHIVGTPSTKSQSEGAILHHTLGNGDFKIYKRMYEEITVAQTCLNQNNAKYEIDRVLRECYIKARPVYISLPFDVCLQEIDVATDLSEDLLSLSLPKNHHDVEYAAINQIVEIIRKANRVIVLVDAGTSRYNATNELLEFVEKTGLPFFTSPMGKGIISEDHPQFGGIYIGNVSESHIRSEVEHADLIISVGSIKSDYNTGGFSYHVNQAKTIEFGHENVKVFFASYEDLSLKQILPKITSCLEDLHYNPQIQPPYQYRLLPEQIESKQIVQNWFWREISSKFLKPNDIIIADTGTSMFGLMDIKFPKGATFISQILYGSIGYSVGATLGAALAARNNQMKRRVILFVGDGSFQVTVQEISTMIRHNIQPIIFILNNEGYTIERTLHGLKREYNDIQQWDFCKTLEYFGGAGKGNSVRISTKDEVGSFIRQFSPDKIQIVEVIMDKFDVPRALLETVKITYTQHVYEEVIPFLKQTKEKRMQEEKLDEKMKGEFNGVKEF